MAGSEQMRRIGAQQAPDSREVDDAPELKRWILAGVVGFAALLGSAILVTLVALVLQPPVWAQVLLGLALVAGVALLAWLVRASLQRTERP